MRPDAATERESGEAAAERGPGEDGAGGASADPAVAVEALRKVYGGGEDAVRAVDGVSFAVESGTAVGLLGPNGAGKTTTIESLLGLVIPDEGTARIAGVDVAEDPREAYRHVGAMLEGARNVYWRLTVRENLRFFAALSGQHPDAVRDRHDELLEQFGLEGKADTAVRDLSRGMKQKVILASTLARDAEVVFLDEPTLGLDVESSIELRRELRRLVEEEALTVLLSSHDMDVIEAVCDRVVVMERGRIVADDTVENLLSLFRTQSYEVEVEGSIGAELRDRLVERFDAGEFESLGERARFAVSVTGDEFYELVDELRAAGATIAAVDAVDPDLEEVFLELTQGRGTGGGDEEATTGGAEDAEAAAGEVEDEATAGGVENEGTAGGVEGEAIVGEFEEEAAGGVEDG